MPNRDDFEREFDNEAETLVSLLAISVDDDPIESELKATNIDIYRRRLAERFRRKSVVREYKLVDLFFKQLQKDNEDGREADELEVRSPGAIVCESNNGTILTKAERKEKRSIVDFGNTSTQDESVVDAKSLESKFRIYSQFQSEPEQQLLIRNLIREQLLKNRLKELLKQRKNSLKKAGNIENASNKSKGSKKKENKKSKVNRSQRLNAIL